MQYEGFCFGQNIRDPIDLACDDEISVFPHATFPGFDLIRESIVSFPPWLALMSGKCIFTASDNHSKQVGKAEIRDQSSSLQETD